ncbi:MAG: Hsp70 family protein [Vibrio sp.]|uniref:Hsp70 family protein n=1 Tax=Vibrio sp. TaxID=678 RepID=UPI003A8405DF
MIIGIDLGTTHSLVSVWQGGSVKLIPNILESYLTPSCVGVDEDASILVGKVAQNRLQTHPDKTAALFKRRMGSRTPSRLGDKEYLPEELSSLVLRALKEDAESYLGQAVEEAIITVPAYFSDGQRKATKTAGRLAGLRVDRIISEPTAAALAYGLHEAPDESTFLIFDLGGGTFDVSIIEKFEGVMEVRATAGDNYLGGEDFTTVIVDHFYAHSGISAKAKNDAAFQQQLIAKAEAVKIALEPYNEQELALVWQSETYSLIINEETFVQLSQELLDRLRAPVERALRDARIRVSDINDVVLAGGASRMPMVRQLVARMFGRFPNTQVNPDEVVAVGAGVMAGLKMKDATLDEVVMTDVCPYTLSIATSTHLPDGSIIHGVSSPIIERNTVIPASRVETYWPENENQRQVTVRVFQGEGRYVKDNIALGELEILLPKKAPYQELAFDVRFTYDVNGLLEVETRLHKTNEIQRLVINSQDNGLSEQEIEQRLLALAALKIHPREKIENRTLLTRSERLYQQLLGENRNRLSMEIMQFEQVLQRQNEKECAAARERLTKVLDFFECDNYFSPEFE